MTTRTPGPDAGAHSKHDRLLIAARAAGELTGRDLDRADAQIATCDACCALEAELRAISRATRQLPPPARPPDLDFTISAWRATALGRHGAWRRLLRPFGRFGSGSVRPLAAAFMTLGIAGLLLATLPALPALRTLEFGSGGAYMAASGSSPGTRDFQTSSLQPEAGATGEAPGDDNAVGTGVDAAGGEAGPDASGGANTAGAAPAGAESQAPGIDDVAGGEVGKGGIGPEPGGSGDPTLLVLVSVGFLGAGLGLFLLRRAALRFS